MTCVCVCVTKVWCKQNSNSKFSFIFSTDSLCKSNEDASVREVNIHDKNKLQSKAYIGTVAGQRGNPKLVLNGFAYIPNKRIKDKTYWNCAQVRQKKCKARLITLGTMDNILVTYSQHSHEQEFAVWMDFPCQSLK